MLNKTIFAQNMAGLCEVYNRELTKTLQNIYYAILKDMQDDDFKQAIKRLLQERVFATFPKPAEILELSSIVKVAQVEVNHDEEQAKELIQWCETANATVFDGAKKSGLSFDDELKRTGFIRLIDNNNDMAVLNAVKPYCEYKQLIGNIRCYQDSQIQLQAFIDAIKNVPSNAIMISNPIERLRISKI